ncbi:MAG: hypothetical protein WBV31_15195 [Terriglobales bacterium]
MKKLLLPSLALCLGFMLICQLRMLPRIALAADARPIAGDWEGTLNPGAQPKKHVVVHISAEQDGSLSGTIDYPDQDTSGIAITAITYKDPALHFESNPNLCVYDGTVNQDDTEIVGTWKQDGSSLSLTLKRTR